MSEGASLGRPRSGTVNDALAWHETAIAQYGGVGGIRDLGLLESALAQPQQGVGGEFSHQFPFVMAAAHAFHLVKIYPFFDGNKRTALLCAGGFLRMNGRDLVSSGTEAADAIIAPVEDRLDRASLAEWLSRRCRRRPSFELRDFFQALTPTLHAEIRSAVRSGSAPELDQSTAGAVAAIPLTGTLIEAGEHHAGRGDMHQAAVAFGEAQLLLHIDRLAEDMGYEW